MKKLYEVKTIDDLKELGPLNEIVQQVEKEVFPMRIFANSYGELLEVISVLQDKWIPFNTGSFVSKRKEYIYYLLEHEGEKREKLLGISDDVYEDKKKANKWYKEIAKIIRADLGDCEDAKKAFQTLQVIYQDLTDDEAFGG